MDKATRDHMQNATIQDTYIHPPDQPWIPFPGADGIGIKVLRVSSETGTWTALFNCAVGSGFARHKHLGAGEYLMVSGKMEVRGGVQNGGITAVAGDYGYEPTGIIHDWTNFVEETVFYFTNYGALQFLDDDDNTVAVLDWQGILAIASMAPALAAV